MEVQQANPKHKKGAKQWDVVKAIANLKDCLLIFFNSLQLL